MSSQRGHCLRDPWAAGGGGEPLREHPNNLWFCLWLHAWEGPRGRDSDAAYCAGLLCVSLAACESGRLPCVFRWPLSNPSSRLPNGSKRGDPLGADEESAGPQSYSQVQNFASQEKAKSAMNHMRWGLASQYAHAPHCSKQGIFGCGGRDFSKAYGHVHEGHSVVFM
eukprot:CAMPEP_0180267626 /NCGR_PEP_ID=MMETSP0988-20121125/1664_1 /TAXON_ID=697907 /ORGANISM="non described non described, Strain CCMP2293" /LENGTH=166 /DNA_ID=CAMNT_0022238347 /DNA_START=89 /DNA_END=590 /DNA_ORIENTATION=+